MARVDTTTAPSAGQQWRTRTTRTRKQFDWDTGATLVVLMGGVVFAALADSRYWTQVLQIFILYSGVAIWNGALLSRAGQVSFGQGAVLGCGAYGAAVAMVQADVPFWAAALVGTATGMAVSALFALPAFRVSGYYLGFLTLSVAIVFPEAVIELPELTGGIHGITAPVERWLFEPWVVSLTPLVVIVAGFGALAVLSYAWLRRSSLGRQMAVAKDSPEAAATLGISGGRARSLAFLMSGAVTGLAGALYVPVVGYVGTEAFNIDLSLLFFFAVIAGGRGYALGATLGVGLLYLVPNVLLAGFVEYRLLAYGLITLLIIALMPAGIVGTAARALKRRRKSSSSEAAGQLATIMKNERETAGG